MQPFKFSTRPLDSFGMQVDADLSRPLDPAQQSALRTLLYGQGVLVFRGQSLSDEDQVRVLGHFGHVLGEEGENREIAPDGNLGNCRLLYHSDLAFTPEPFKLLSLYGIDVDDGKTTTLFASGTRVLSALPRALRDSLPAMTATTVIPPLQTERAVGYDMPAFLPQVSRPVVIEHPVTREPILYISEMQTARIDGLPPAESEETLQELFKHLYAPDNVYEHVWHQGDLVIWDNIALQHGRPDQANTRRRRLRRVAVADKTFYQLCPEFRADDPMVIAWGAGKRLMLE